MLNNKIISFTQSFNVNLIYDKSDAQLLENIPKKLISKYLIKATEYDNLLSFNYLLYHNVTTSFQINESKILFNVYKNCVNLKRYNIMRHIVDYCMIDDITINRLLSWLIDMIIIKDTTLLTIEENMKFIELFFSSCSILLNHTVIKKITKMKKNKSLDTYNNIIKLYDTYNSKREYTNKLVARISPDINTFVSFDPNKLIPFYYGANLFICLCHNIDNIAYIKEIICGLKLTFIMKILLLIVLYNEQKLEFLNEMYQHFEMNKYFENNDEKIIHTDIFFDMIMKNSNVKALIYFQRTYKIYYLSYYFAYDTIMVSATSGKLCDLSDFEWVCDTYEEILQTEFKKTDKYKLMYIICKLCDLKLFEYLDKRLNIFIKPNHYYETILAQSMEIAFINNTLYQNFQIADYLANKFNKYKIVEKEYLIYEAHDSDDDTNSDYANSEDINSEDASSDDEYYEENEENIIMQNLEEHASTDDNLGNNIDNNIDNNIINVDGNNYIVAKVYDYVPLTDDEKKYSIVVNTKHLNKKKKVLGITDYVKIPKSEEIHCLICLDDSKELLQLNCKHYCCITCLCKWYRNTDNNKNSCIYCKQNIIWPECKLVEKS